jgi:hypothetical protein
MYLLRFGVAGSCGGFYQPTEAAMLGLSNRDVGNFGLEPGGGVRGLYLQGRSRVVGRASFWGSMGQILAGAGGGKTPIMEVTP